MQVTRHYLDVGGRRVHYRRCGSGPPLLMVHQSPRSSAEYAKLMVSWGTHFTCIAPDTPGFGQSVPLAGEPEITDFADALCAFIDVLGCGPLPAYGFHSGGIILITALNRRPDLFTALAIGGYAIWTAQEMALFGDRYLPPLVPAAYGEHLTWLWNRMLEQSWFFPWFDVRNETRLSVAHADVDRVHAAVMDMLDAGDAYRAGYGAVLRAPRDIPPADAVTPPVLITAYDGDPLQAHIDRLGPLPSGWSAERVSSPAQHHAVSFAFLQRHAGADKLALPAHPTAGFLAITTSAFAGMIHWQGRRGASLLRLHPPGAELAWDDDAVTIDLPGHGLSDGWPGAPPVAFEPWAAVVEAARVALAAERVMWPHAPDGDPARLFPDLTPDRFGTHLTRAFAIARASALFAPWYDVAANIVDIDQRRIAPDAIQQAARALLRAPAARAWATALQSKPQEESNHVNP
jgi:alpha-beta hydrolase superfamily lysophospholipase